MYSGIDKTPELDVMSCPVLYICIRGDILRNYTGCIQFWEGYFGNYNRLQITIHPVISNK